MGLGFGKKNKEAGDVDGSTAAAVLAPDKQTGMASFLPDAMEDASAREKMFLLAGPVALVGVILLALVSILQNVTADDTEYATLDDVNAQITRTSKVANFATDYVSLWLAGQGADRGTESPHEEALARMSSITGPNPSLPTTPYRINSARGWLAPDGWFEAGSGTVWRTVVEVKAVQPGASRVSTLLFEVDVAEAHDTYRVNALPRPVARIESPIRVLSPYKNEVRKGSAMFTAAQNYASAYLTPGGDGANLGATTGPDYTGEPVTGGLWRDATVTAVNYYDQAAAIEGGTPIEASSASPGDRLETIITVKASTSTASFTTLQIPVVMEMLPNGQWVVAEFSQRVFFDGVEAA